MNINEICVLTPLNYQFLFKAVLVPYCEFNNYLQTPMKYQPLQNNN